MTTKRLVADIELTNELLEEVCNMNDVTKAEARKGLVSLFKELNDPKRLALLLENLDYFNY